jgi:hypothetical protein
MLTIDRAYDIWADESAFFLQRSTSNISWMTSTTPKLLLKKDYNPMIHLWGANCTSGKSKLKLLTCNESWNGNTLVDTFENYLLPFQQMYFKEGFYYFIHENATPTLKENLLILLKIITCQITLLNIHLNLLT